MLMTFCRSCAEFFTIEVDNTLSSMYTKDDAGVKVPLTDVRQVCQHSKEERAFVTVVETSELAHALEKGYRVRKLYNAVYWPLGDVGSTTNPPQWTTELFKGSLALALFS